MLNYIHNSLLLWTPAKELRLEVTLSIDTLKFLATYESRLRSFKQTLSIFFSLINIAYADITQTHSIQSTQSKTFIIYVKFFGEIIIFRLSSILYVTLRFQLDYSQSLLPPTSDIRTN